MMVRVIQGFRLGATFSFLLSVLMCLLSPALPQEIVSNARIPACVDAAKGQRLIGWGKYGLFFAVPKRGVKILGGKPDVDYVKFVIHQPKA